MRTRSFADGERVFRLLVETIEDYAMCALDTEGRIARWNTGAVRCYGYSEAEIIGRPIAIIFTEEDRIGGVPGRELQLRRAPLDLRETITAAAEMVDPEARARSVPVLVSCPGSPVMISGDTHRLLQIFTNLLTNAVKFSSKGTTVTIDVAGEGEEAVVRVVDRGAGIPPDRLVSIFDLFSQAHTRASGSEPGVGIGLALTRDLVALHEGTIQVRSEGLGKGSEFVVRFPLAEGGQGITP